MCLITQSCHAMHVATHHCRSWSGTQQVSCSGTPVLSHCGNPESSCNQRIDTTALVCDARECRWGCRTACTLLLCNQCLDDTLGCLWNDAKVCRVQGLQMQVLTSDQESGSQKRQTGQSVQQLKHVVGVQKLGLGMSSQTTNDALLCTGQPMSRAVLQSLSQLPTIESMCFWCPIYFCTRQCRALHVPCCLY